MKTQKKRKFKMVYLFIALAVALCLYVSLGPKLKNMQEGMWEITVETKMPGTEMSVPYNQNKCLTKADPVPDISLPGYECRLLRKRPEINLSNSSPIWWPWLSFTILNSFTSRKKTASFSSFRFAYKRLCSSIS